MEDFTGGSYGAAKGSFAAHFDAWSIFVAILKLGDHFITISKFGNHFTSIWKFGNHLATKWKFRSPFLKLGAFSQRGIDFAEEGNFCSPFHSCEMGVWRCEVALVCQRVVSQLRNTLRNGGAAAKFPLWLCVVRLQTTITPSFQLPIAYHLKHWTPDFPRFETRYGMHEMNFGKYFEMCPTGVRLQHFSSWCAR